MICINNNIMHIAEGEFAAYYYAEPKWWLGLLSAHFRLFNLKVLHDGDVIPEMNPPLPLVPCSFEHCFGQRYVPLKRICIVRVQKAQNDINVSCYCKSFARNISVEIITVLLLVSATVAWHSRLRYGHRTIERCSRCLQETHRTFLKRLY